MAHRIILQVAVTGARVFGRAVTEAWRQAAASQKYAAAAKANGGTGAGGGGASTFAASGLTLEEACKILNVPPPKGAATDMTHVTERFKKLFDLNEPSKGGSFYLQSKILRARERIEMEVAEAESRSEAEHAAKEGWKPKVYKDR